MCIYKDEDSNLKHRTFAHVMDGVRQDWLAVAYLLEDTLHHIKIQLPKTTRAFLRSDNAGCYHCGNLWLAIQGISISIASYDFSEAQSGKSYCDAEIAHMRGKLSKEAASGHNIITAADMKSAIDLHGGTTGCQASRCQASHVELLEKPSPTAKCPIKGITRISNVKFGEGLITTWRAYNIGRGKEFPIEHENNDIADLEIKSGFVASHGAEGNIRKPTDSRNDVNSAVDHCFPCPEEGCTQTFTRYGDMQNHCFLGNHTYKLQAMSTYDDIKMRWRNACSSLSEDTLKHSSSTGEDSQIKVMCSLTWGGP